MRLSAALSALFSACLVAATAPSPTTPSKRAPSFITTSGDQFLLDGKPFKFVGTNAYWIPSLNSDQDINATLSSIAAIGVKVIRIWAFNDVTEVPANGTWFQLIQNGTFTINTGPTGLQRLDTVVTTAERLNLKIIFSLTNNWNPQPLIDGSPMVPVGAQRRENTAGTNSSLPRNFLSNDYGGMDFYVRQLGKQKMHDEFYTDQTILNAFKNYTTQIVSRYVNSPAIFAWELANDPRCNSTLPATSVCNTNTVTAWHADVGAHIHSVDPNHLVSSGAQGFMCMDCPKLFPRLPPPPPPPQVSPAPGRKRAVAPLTAEILLRKRAEARKRNKEALKRIAQENGSGIMIRGRWVASREAQHVSRQSGSLGSAFDGSFGVDSEDIVNAPQINFHTFQLFPDQNVYAPTDPALSSVQNMIQVGLDWISANAQIGQQFRKPVAMTAFGLVTQNNAGSFVPFNATTPPAASTGTTSTAPVGVSDTDQTNAYNQWITAAANNGVNGVVQYQWGQTGLAPQPGTAISPNNAASGSTPNTDSTGISPNDGYGNSQSGTDTSTQAVLNSATALFG